MYNNKFGGNIMRRQKKLLARSFLLRLKEQADLGVPIKRIIRRYNLSITAPTLVRLFENYDLIEEYSSNSNTTKADIVHNSLFPVWLDKDLVRIQLQPKEWKYTGRFPLGKWIKEGENEND